MVGQIRANAALVVDVAAKELKTAVAYDEIGVRWLDGYIQRQHESGDPALRAKLVSPLGSYLGECLVRVHGGEWIQDGGTWGVRIGRGTAYPFAKVTKQLDEGHVNGESILTFFTAVPALFKGGVSRP